MKLRIFTEPQLGADYPTLLRVATATEELGFDAFFRSDHFLTMGDSPGLPGPTDSWVTLAGLALQTTRIRLGTLVTAATFRLPGPLAISVAQVDQMSGGRVEFGFGTGWFQAEHSAYGIPFPSLTERFARFEEQLAIITGLWETPEGRTFSYDGTYYQLADSPALPKPAQRPRPPVILGGAGTRRTPRLAARYADEFNLAFKNVPETSAAFGRVREACREAGRDPRRSPCPRRRPWSAGRTTPRSPGARRRSGREPDDLRTQGLDRDAAEVTEASADTPGPAPGRSTCRSAT